MFVRGQASLQATYGGTNVPIVYNATAASGKTLTLQESNHAWSYPGLLFHVGVTPTSQITVVLPSSSTVTSTQTGDVTGATDMEFRYKQLAYVDRKNGVLGGFLLTYEAPTGSPGLTAGVPSYQVNPLLNIALNRSRTLAENLSFPVTNGPSPAGRAWSFAPQAVTAFRSPGGTLLAGIVSYSFATHYTYLTFNAAQLLSRYLQLQGTFGGNNALVDYANPIQDVDVGKGTAYSRSFTIGLSYMIGSSDLPPQ